MCHATMKPGRDSTICIYCGSTNHTLVKCTNRPDDNREEPRLTPRDLQDYKACNTGNNNLIFDQNYGTHHQARFNKRFNRQYSPNYNNFQPSPLGSISGQDLSATLLELANIQSMSLEIMATNLRNQQETFNELTKASKDKANNTMFASIKTYDGKNRQGFADWIDKINQACQLSNHDFRTEIIKKLTGAVQQVVMACDNYSDDELLAELRSCFSDTPTMNQAREELRNMRQMENDSITVYTYKWG